MLSPFFLASGKEEQQEQEQKENVKVTVPLLCEGVSKNVQVNQQSVQRWYQAVEL